MTARYRHCPDKHTLAESGASIVKPQKSARKIARGKACCGQFVEQIAADKHVHVFSFEPRFAYCAANCVTLHLAFTLLKRLFAPQIVFQHDVETSRKIAVVFLWSDDRKAAFDIHVFIEFDRSHIQISQKSNKYCRFELKDRQNSRQVPQENLQPLRKQ